MTSVAWILLGVALGFAVVVGVLAVALAFALAMACDDSRSRGPKAEQR